MVGKNVRLIPLAVVAVALLVTAAFSGAGGVWAQDATPSATDLTVAHPAHIHTGACAALGGIAYPLNDVSAPGSPMTRMGTPVGGTPEAMATPALSESATPMPAMGPVIVESVTTVNVSLSNLEASAYAINVHESLPKITTYIACGDITGAAVSGSLTIQLNQLNRSGLLGTATLTDNGDGTTTVSVQLRQPIA